MLNVVFRFYKLKVEESSQQLAGAGIERLRPQHTPLEPVSEQTDSFAPEIELYPFSGTDEKDLPVLSGNPVVRTEPQSDTNTDRKQGTRLS